MEDLRQSGYIIAPDLPPHPPTHPKKKVRSREEDGRMGYREREREITTETGAEESSVQEFDLRECWKSKLGGGDRVLENVLYKGKIQRNSQLYCIIGHNHLLRKTFTTLDPKFWVLSTKDKH